MADLNKYHVTLEDPNTGETLGLLLREGGGALGRVARLANPYAAKVGGGDRTLSDLTDLSAYGQSDWRAGRGQDRFEEEDRFYDSRRAETRIKGQITLGPLAVSTGVGDAPTYQPGSVVGVPIGKLSETYQGRGMCFLAPSGGITCTHVTLRLRATQSGEGQADRNFTVALYTHSDGLPDALVTSTTINLKSLGTSFDEIKVTWSSGEALTGSTTYWILVEETTPKLSAAWWLEWAADTTASYASGAAARKPREWTVAASDIGGSDKIDEAAWVLDTSRDFWFAVNDGPVLAGDVTVDPVRYADGFYCAADDTVYKWSGSIWESSEVQADKTVTSMVVWGDYLWVARGANTMRRWDDAEWGDAPGAVQARLVYQYQGYLYRTDPTNLEDMYYTSDGTNWSPAIHVGPGDWGISGLAGFRDELAIANDVGLWLLAADWTYQVLDWGSQEDGANGHKMRMWGRTNELFIPVQYGLYRWTGATMVSEGPDADAGLPEERTGSVAALCGTVNWLYAAIDAGASGRSSVLAYAGRDWHEVYRAMQDGKRIRALGYETLSDPPRLWFGEGDVMRYVELPDFTDNPYQYTGIKFEADAEVDFSAWGSELLPVAKDWRYLIVQSENCAAGRAIEFYYEIDRSGLWTLMGTIDDANTLHKLSFPSSGFATKITGSGSTATTIELASGVTVDVAAGDWVKIGSEIRQVASVTDVDTFALALPLSSAPAAGVSVYASGAVGSEIRLRTRLTTGTDTETPLLLAVACYCDANVIDRWQITLDARVEDGMDCLDSSPYPMDAVALAGELDKWITRQTPFTLHDLRGTQRTVKVANAVEVTPVRGAQAPWQYSSTMHIGLIEVEAT